MNYEERIHCPEGTIVVTQVDEHNWRFEYSRISREVLEEFHKAIDQWQTGDITFAEELYNQLVNDYPEFIDVYHHLALLLSETGRDEEAFQIWKDVVEMCLDCLPKEFEMGRSRLSWLILENRPFLRTYHGLGLEYLERGEIEKAHEIFKNILSMNPNDNQGVRAIVIDCNFRLNRPSNVLVVCDQYFDDVMEQVMYGRVLALYQLGQKTEAEKALRKAIECIPLVAEELVKIRHQKPKDLHPDYVKFGGADQAYYYWIEQGEHWKNTSGALELVRDCLKRSSSLSNN